MPGGRLTHDDRREIATGLQAGLGYAEIARQLDRPTSTISREVARNGGARGYRADHAHYSTASRARRSPGKATNHAELQPDGDQQVRDFVERFATMMVEGGLPRMASRVLARLYTADSRSLTAADLVRELCVSPASISTAVGYLEQVGMVHREPDPERRLQHYVIADDVWLQAWKVSARTNLNWAETATEGAALLGPGTPAGERLTHMADFFHRLGEDMSGGPAFELIDDALTALAVLLHAARPLSANQLAAALDWPPERLAEALGNAAKYVEYTDPVVLHQPSTGTYQAIPTPGRLTATQRAAVAPTPATTDA
ncbi:MarR family transcriptional regulator [Kribbella capetownensis]|uniref:MarR family transcriptional regulator n=1 Tax=Kribbella capetownensis TaxID=1572659 RepID=A0A4R0JK55_9ACTN|nr:helix-turn-helix domain-containing protein [Kribbella capetownensis]TCC45118.1 MarR family transcriptional regulator [Kribbella capetownensis]